MKRMKHIWLLVISITFFVMACSNDSDNSESEGFDIAAQLEYIFDDGIQSQIDLLQSRATNFKLLVEVYENSPREENFKALKSSWEEMTLAWKPLEMVTIGDFALISKVSSIHFWPIDVEILEANIQNYSEENFELGTTAKGLGALEYILFSVEYKEFIDNEDSENSIAYLGVLIDELIVVIDSYDKAWLDYEDEFKTSVETSVTGTQNRLFNQIVFAFFDIIVDKIQGTIVSNTEGVDPLNSESPYSELSLEIIKAQIEYVNKLFSGNLNEQEITVAIYDQLNSVGREDLVEALEDQFEKINLSFSLTNESLESLVIEESEVLNQIEEDIIALHTLINNDVFSALSIITSVSDNDGD